MRILVISFLFPNSMYPNRGMFVLNRLKAVQRYADVKVINPIIWFPFCSRLDRYKNFHRIPKKEVIDGIEVYHPRFFSIPVILKIVVAFTYCLAVLPIALRLRKKWAFDLIDLHWTYPDLPTGRVLGRFLKRKQLVTVRGTPALHLEQRNPHSALMKRALRKSDQVITLSDQLKDLSIGLGVSSDKVVTIRNGVDSEAFHYDDRPACREALGIPSATKMILGIGYLTPRKGFDRVINALPELLRNCPDVHLYLIGPDGAFAQGDVTDSIRQLAQDLGVTDHVHFVGEVANPELYKWYNAADCFCLSSRSEGCPNVLLEALACGCPVVATDVGAVSEVVADESLGIVVPSSTDGVRAGLLEFLAKEYDRRAIAERMREFDWDWCARQVRDLYRKQLGSDTVETGQWPAESSNEPVSIRQ